MLKLKKILVPVDFSKEAELALEWAVKLAKEEKNSIIYLLHVIPPVPVSPEVGYELQKMTEVQMKKAKEDLARWKKKVPSSVVSVNICDVGDLVDEIRTVCEKEKIDVVIMTTAGRTGLTRMVHPNVTEKVVRTAPCPVLALHLNTREAASAV